MVTATRDHGLNNPRFFVIVEVGENELQLRQLSRNEVPEGLVFVDGWLDDELQVFGREAEIASVEGTWGYVFGQGVKNSDIQSCFPEGWKVTISS